MMKRMSFSETIFLFFLALIIFGPKKLPEIARQVGKWMAEFRRASNEFKSQIEQEIAHLEVESSRQTILPPSPSPEGTASRTLNPGSSEAAPQDAPSGAEPSARLNPSEEPHRVEPLESRTVAVVEETVTSSNSEESHA
jgi:sec-independent protein translocase protein TatB